MVARWFEVDHEPGETREVSVFEGFPREKRLGPGKVIRPGELNPNAIKRDGPGLTPDLNGVRMPASHYEMESESESEFESLLW